MQGHFKDSEKILLAINSFPVRFIKTLFRCWFSFNKKAISASISKYVNQWHHWVYEWQLHYRYRGLDRDSLMIVQCNVALNEPIKLDDPINPRSSSPRAKTRLGVPDMRLCCALKIEEQNSFYRNYPTDMPDEIISFGIVAVRLHLFTFQLIRRSVNRHGILFTI